MKTIKNNINAIVLIFGLMMPLCVNAETSTTIDPQIIFDDNVDDVPAPPLPIDGLLGLGLAAGAYLGLRKKFKNAN